jgi:peptide/nickel transport system permease protein
VASVIVIGSLQLGTVIIAEASLTFLGLGIPPSIPTWGSMLATGREYFVLAWWLPTFPGLAIVVTVLAVNFLGDWLRDVFDPTL